MSFADSLKSFIYQMFFVHTWGPEKLAHYIQGLQKYKSLPSKVGLPDYIVMPNNFWDKVKTMRRYTDKDGHEYASSVYAVDSDIILTPIIRGEPSYVNVKYNIKWHYEPLDSSRYIKKVYVNNEKVLEKTVYKYQIPQKLYATYLFSIHTHPYHEEVGAYSFFSRQDIRSLISSSSVAVGLITDKFYLVFKTGESVKSWPEHEQVTVKNLNKNRFVLYTAPFYGKMEKYR